MNRQEQQRLYEVFKKISLELAGIFGVYDADEDMMWAVTRSLDIVFEEYLGA